MASPPVIGITVDNRDNDRTSGIYEVRIAYCERVERSGGLPVLLPHAPERAEEYVDLCQGLLLTGGADPRVERFGAVTAPDARRMDERRMEFELALLEVARRRSELPVLAVCLGMQLMALHHGGELEQSLLRSRGEIVAATHTGDRRHPIEILHLDSVLARDLAIEGHPEVVSQHRQGVADAGQLRIVARAPDGLIEAIDDPCRPFYLGVQWHPERNRSGDSAALNQDLIARFVEACQIGARRP